MQHTSNCMRLTYVAADIILNEDNDTEGEEDTKFNTKSIGLSMYRLLVSDNFRETVFSNTVITFHIYLSMMLSNCSGERSFLELIY